jgi:hypothetical protein
MLLMITMSELSRPREHEVKIDEPVISMLLNLAINDFFVNQISKS